MGEAVARINRSSLTSKRRAAILGCEVAFQANTAKSNNEIEKLKPDSAVDFSDTPLQDPIDPKWNDDATGKFHRTLTAFAKQ